MKWLIPLLMLTACGPRKHVPEMRRVCPDETATEQRAWVARCIKDSDGDNDPEDAIRACGKLGQQLFCPEVLFCWNKQQEHWDPAFCGAP